MPRSSMVAARVLLPVLLLLAPGSTGAAGPPLPFGPAVQELRLALVLPELDATRDCGGLCGLTHGSSLQVVLAVENLGRKPRRVALELTCSGYDTTLSFERVPEDRAVKGGKPQSFGLQRRLSCFANAPKYRLLKPGEVVRFSVAFKVPPLPPGSYAVTARSQVVPEKGKAFTLTSAAIRRLIHR